MRIFASLIAFLTLATGAFFAEQYYTGRQVLVQSNPSYATDFGEELTRLVFILGLAVSFLFALLIYTALTTRASARRIAYTLTRDISFSKEKFRRFYELSPVPYLLINQHGRIERPNKASLRFFGKDEETLRGKNMLSFISVPDHPEKLALYRERISRHVPIEQVEVQITKENGEVRWVLLSIEDLTTPGSNDHEGLVTIVDIHEQKELERIKTEFLSLASHQLRAPLANIKWYIDFLLTRRAEGLTADVLAYLHKIYRRNEDMIELVNTLLNLSRIEMGRVSVDTEQVNISELSRSVVEELEPVGKEKEITISVEVPEGVLCTTDGKLVRIIVQNLLSNALRYTPKSGHVRLALSISRTEGVRVEVTDDGIGIPPEEQASIFSKLYRATNAKEMEVNGNGIGLYMCKSLAESLGGTLDFVSTVGKGTTFTLKLPA